MRDQLLAASSAGAVDLANVDAFVSAQMQANHLPGLALGIVHDKQIVDLRGFGTADQSGRAVTPHTPFVIGSLTKSFTALAVLQLVEAGKVQLDAPVQHYLPWFRLADPLASAGITVRQLLNQTSGIPASLNGLNTGEIATMKMEQFVHALKAVALDRPVLTCSIGEKRPTPTPCGKLTILHWMSCCLMKQAPLPNPGSPPSKMTTAA